MIDGIDRFTPVKQDPGQPGLDRYSGTDPSTRRSVEIQVLTAEWAREPALRDHLARDATAYRTLEHAQIAPLLDFGQTAEGGWFYVTARPAGDLLAKQIERAWSPKDAARLISDLASPLNFAHARRVTHAALSPSVIFLDKRRQSFITDFALRRTIAEAAARASGTPPPDWQWLPPEIVEDRPTDHRVDVYALGVLLYRLLAGAAWLPIERRTFTPDKYQPLPLASEIIPNLAPDLNDILIRALEFQPAARWPTTSALAEALEKSSALSGRRRAAAVYATGRRSTRDFGKPAAVVAVAATGSVAEPPTLDDATLEPIDRASTGLPPTKPGYEWQQVRRPATGRRLLTFGLKLFGWLFATCLLSIVLVALLLSVITSSIAERVLSVQTWHLAQYDPAGPVTMTTAEFQASASALISNTLGGSLTNVSIALTPPNDVIMTGQWENTPVRLRMQAYPVDGVLQLRFLSFNDLPLIGVGDILAGGINRGLRTSWLRTSNRLDRLDFSNQQIAAYLQRPPGYQSPTPTPQPTATEAPTGAPTEIPTKEPTLTTTPTLAPTVTSTVTPSRTPKPTATGGSSTPKATAAATISTVVAANITATPTARATAALPPGGIGRILFTTDLGSLFLYSIDPADSKPKQIGQTDAAHSTCGRQVSTADGQALSTYSGPYCALARIQSCVSPDGKWEAIYSGKGREDGTGTLRVQPKGDESQSRFIFDGPVNASQGIRWAPNSGGFIFYVAGNYFLAHPGNDGFQPIGSGDILSWSPDSTMLLIKAVNEIGLQRLDGTPLQYLIQGQLVSSIQCPVWRGY